MKNTARKTLILALVLVMCLSLFDLSALAAESPGTPDTETTQPGDTGSTDPGSTGDGGSDPNDLPPEGEGDGAAEGNDSNTPTEGEGDSTTEGSEDDKSDETGGDAETGDGTETGGGDGTGGEESASGVAQVNGVGYGSLAEAVEAAGDGDTVTLLGDTVIDAEVAVHKTITIDLNGAVITASKPLVVRDGSLTIRGGTLRAAEGARSRAIDTDPSADTLIMSDVVVEGFSSDLFYGAVRIRGKAHIERCTFNGNDVDISMGNTYDGQNVGGGAIYINGEAVDVTITDSCFNENGVKATESGTQFGGGAILASEVGGKVEIESCAFTGNQATYGGGAFLLNNFYKTVSLTIRDCDFEGNKAVGPNPDFYSGGLGGAVAVKLWYAAYDCTVELLNNTVNDNEAHTLGGGYYLEAFANLHPTLVLAGGRITNNRAETGGGIDYSIEGQVPLMLTDVRIDNNEARYYGGGIWTCPSSETTVYSTLGGAIYGNTAGRIGDDARYSGRQSGQEDYTTPANENPGSFVRLAARSLGGYPLNWSKDELGARYDAGDPVPVDDSVYAGTDEAFAAHSGLSADGQRYAEDHAMLVISGNYANYRGGGIASNSPIIIGQKDADESLHVRKVWREADGSEAEEDLPESVQVTLVRVQGESRVDLETVALSAENGWEYTFTDLPAYDGSGDFSYTVREADVSGWTGAVGETVPAEGGGNAYAVELTNTREPVTPPPSYIPTPEYGSLTVSKAVAGGGDEAAEKVYSFTVTGPNGYSAALEITGSGSQTLTGLTPGAYTVTEADASLEGFTWSVSGEGSVTVSANANASITVTNTYEPDRDIPDDDVPQDEEPEIPEEPREPEAPEAPETPEIPEIPDQEPPLAELPEEEPPVEIPEEDVPLDESPKTGDNTQLILWLALMIGSGLALAVLVITGKKRTK